MGKSAGKKKKKKQTGMSQTDAILKQTKVGANCSKVYDKDIAVFISMARELKEEGNKLFQMRYHEGAILKYEKALKLLPTNHIEVSCLRSNIAACYMQLDLSEYPRAIHECNLALEVTPKYSKALLKRARCYEALSRLDLALRDVTNVLNMEPNNLMALEIAERVKVAIESRDINVESPCPSLPPELIQENSWKKEEKVKRNANEDREAEEKVEDEVIVENKQPNSFKEEPKKMVKLVFGEDIRWARLPFGCDLLQLREVIRDRFPNTKAVLIKYRDHEGDLVTITTNEELSLAEASADSQSAFRLYVVDVKPEQDLFFEKVYKQENGFIESGSSKNKRIEKPSCIDDWIIQFAQLFKNYVGFESDAYLDLHELGIKLYSEAMEETVTSKEAEDLFDAAAEKFQEMAALALFNWGNVHMSKARKRVSFKECSGRESAFEQIKEAYDFAQEEHLKASTRYEEALKIKPDFYEGFLALGQLQFEQAKLSWHYATSEKTDLDTCPSAEVLELYNKAEGNMESGMQMWEELEEEWRNQLSEPSMAKLQMRKMGLDGLIKDISIDEASEQTANMKSQINLLWGTMLYERSIVEYKLGLPTWHECLEVAVEKFEIAGASPTDVAVMIKNHCSNSNALEGVGFKINEIIQAWNEMYEAKRWQNDIPSFRLEPLFRRRVSKIYHDLEHV